MYTVRMRGAYRRRWGRRGRRRRGTGRPRSPAQATPLAATATAPAPPPPPPAAAARAADSRSGAALSSERACAATCWRQGGCAVQAAAAAEAGGAAGRRGRAPGPGASAVGTRGVPRMRPSPCAWSPPRGGAAWRPAAARVWAPCRNEEAGSDE